MSNDMFSAGALSDEELFQRMIKMRQMLSSQSCHNHIGMADSIGMNLAILEEEYENRQAKQRLEAQEKRAKKSDKPLTVDSNCINVGIISATDDPYSGL